MAVTKPQLVATEPRTLDQKLAAIMGEIESLPKDGRNEFHRYSYTSEAAIKHALHPLFVKHGILPQWETVSIEILQAKDKKDATQFLTTATIRYEFRCVETGEKISGTWAGQGMDPGDKGLYKAFTGAIKSCLMSQFLIPTGDDPEADSANDKRLERGATPPQRPPAQAGPAPECPGCGSRMKLRPAGETKDGRAYGPFWACSKYPGCKETLKIQPKADYSKALKRLDEILPEEEPFSDVQSDEIQWGPQ